MATPAREDVLLLRPSPRRWLPVLAIGCVLVAAGVAMLGRHPWIGGACIALFGACVAVAVVQLIPGASHLRLDARGFELRSLYRSNHFAWRDIGDIGTMRVALRPMVGWNFVAGYQGHGRLRRLNTGVSGFEAALPDTYGRTAKDLAATMQAWRAQHLATP